MAGKWRLEDELDPVVGNWFSESDEAAQQKEMSSWHSFCHLGN